MERFVIHIYKIILQNTAFYYIGSTTKKLELRLKQHEAMAKKYPDRKLYKAINANGGFKNASIFCIKSLWVNSKKEQILYENLYLSNHILNNDCLNHNRAIITDEEKRAYSINYRNNHKEQMREYYIANKKKLINNMREYRLKNLDKFIQYRNNNKERLKAYFKEYYLKKKINKHNNTL